MKIIVTSPGHLKTVPMGGYSITALQGLGHDAGHFSLSASLADKLAAYIFYRKGKRFFLNKRFRLHIKKEKPQLIIHIFGFDLDWQSVEFLKNYRIVSVCWWLNDPFQLARSIDRAGMFDAVFTNARGVVRDYKNAGVDNVHWLPVGIDPMAHRPRKRVKELQSDICFVGDWSKEREEWCNFLGEHYDVLVLGPWGKKLNRKLNHSYRLLDGFFDVDMMMEAFSSAKLIFNIHTWINTSSTGTNPRLFEASASGVPQLVDDKDELTDLYRKDDEIVVYKDKKELLVEVDRLLSNEKLRNLIGARALERARIDHTYQERMRKLIEQTLLSCRELSQGELL